MRQENRNGKQTQEAEKLSDKQMPEAKFRAGAIRSTVWANHRKDASGNDVTYYSVSLDRGYKDKEGAWQSTTSMRVGDLPKAALVLNKAYEYIVFHGNEAVESA